MEGMRAASKLHSRNSKKISRGFLTLACGKACFVPVAGGNYDGKLAAYIISCSLSLHFSGDNV